MLDKPTHQEAEPALEELSEEEDYMLSILPPAVQELEETARFFNEAAEMYRASTARLKGSMEKLYKTGYELRRTLGKPIPSL